MRFSDDPEYMTMYKEPEQRGQGIYQNGQGKGLARTHC